MIAVHISPLSLFHFRLWSISALMRSPCSGFAHPFRLGVEKVPHPWPTRSELPVVPYAVSTCLALRDAPATTLWSRWRLGGWEVAPLARQWLLRCDGNSRGGELAFELVREKKKIRFNDKGPNHAHLHTRTLSLTTVCLHKAYRNPSGAEGDRFGGKEKRREPPNKTTCQTHWHGSHGPGVELHTV